jgi:hypothetical protein
MTSGYANAQQVRPPPRGTHTVGGAALRTTPIRVVSGLAVDRGSEVAATTRLIVSAIITTTSMMP